MQFWRVFNWNPEARTPQKNGHPLYVWPYQGNGRVDDPEHDYLVLYVADSPEGAAAEAFGHYVRWTPAVLDGTEQTVEARRARELRPVFAAADMLLDIHSTTFAVRPMLVYTKLEKMRRMALALESPSTHIVSPGGKHQGGLLIEFGAFGDPKAANTAVVVECGPHFARRSGDVAIQTTLRFLDRCGVLDPEFGRAHIKPAADAPPSTYEISEVCMCRNGRAGFVRPLEGFEEFAAGELIGSDGEREIRAPYDRCAVLMPKAQLVPGREMVTLAQRH